MPSLQYLLLFVPLLALSSSNLLASPSSLIRTKVGKSNQMHIAVRDRSDGSRPYRGIGRRQRLEIVPTPNILTLPTKTASIVLIHTEHLRNNELVQG